ncbi:MAG: hypothetical protein RL266_1660, partial [Bacteroidota bacterium]
YSNYHQLHKNWKLSFEATQRDYQLYQTFDHFKLEDAINYKISLANLMARAQGANNHEWFNKAISELKGAPVNSFNEEGEVFQNVYFQEHLFYINNGKFKEAKALVPYIIDGLNKYEAKINKARVLAFQFNIMIMYFIMHEFREALKWSETLLSDKSEIKQHQKYVTALLLPFIHFELGHTELVESFARSAYRLLHRKNRLHQFERLILKFLQNMPLSVDQDDFKPMLNQLHDELVSLLEDPDIPMVLGMEEITLWAKSHYRGMKMSDLINSEDSGSVE